MHYGTIVDMNNKNALITKAMLAAYIEKKRLNYLDLLIPFVKKGLSKLELGEINILSLNKDLNENYGLNININTLIKILISLSKDKKGKYIEKKKGEKNRFYLVKLLDADEFDSQKRTISNEIKKVVEALTNYMNAGILTQKITQEDAKKALWRFLEEYNYNIYDNVEYAKTIKKKQNGKYNCLVARFIIDEYSKNSDIYNAIRDIQVGHFASNAIYYYMESDTNDLTKHLEGTKFYLDTTILIDVLGLNYEQDHIATQEMIKIIKRNGGRLCTFHYYIEELRGIIYKFLKYKDVRLNLDLDLYRREKYSDTQINLDYDMLEKNIIKSGIVIESEPDYSEMIDSQKWHINEEELRSALIKNVGYSDDFEKRSLVNDINTIRTISFYREDVKKCNVNNCRCLFITDNTDIIYTLHRLYYVERFKHGEINFAMTDVDLTAYLWLSDSLQERRLPEMVLLENAYAALKPTSEVMKEACRLIEADINKSSGEIKEELQILRCDYALREDLVDLTGNDCELVEPHLIDELRNRMKNRNKKEIAQEYFRKYEKRDLDLSKREIEVEKKEAEIQEKERQHKREVELREKNKLLQKDSDELKKIKEQAYNRCKEYAENLSILIRYAIFSLGVLVLGIVSCIVLYFDWNSLKFDSILHIIMSIILICVELFGVFSGIGCISNISNVFQEKFFRWSYEMFISKSKVI